MEAYVGLDGRDGSLGQRSGSRFTISVFSLQKNNSERHATLKSDMEDG
jgi:hypothetical protein